MQKKADEVVARWQAVPTGLRQSMAVIAAGVGVLVLLLSWQVPRYTTWLVSAAGGAALLLFGGIAVLQIYAPSRAGSIPPPHLLLAIGGAMTLAGMGVQRAFFWPGKQQSRERAKDRGGETVPAM
jgi:hypothetical protein